MEYDLDQVKAAQKQQLMGMAMMGFMVRCFEFRAVSNKLMHYSTCT